MKIVVLGAGNWGTTIAVVLAHQDKKIHLWTSSTDRATELNTHRQNMRYLPGIKIPPEVIISVKYSCEFSSDDILILAIPSSKTRNIVSELATHLNGILPYIVTASKGLEYGSLKTNSQIVEELLPGSKVMCMTGPNIAREIAEGQPAKAVLACRCASSLIKVSKALLNDRIIFRLSNDIIGAELCGALKGVVAIGIGIADALGLGANTQGLILAQGLKEFVELANFFSASKESIYGLPGLADLATTCLSCNSRNRKFGFLIGKGHELEEALNEVGMAVEGVNMVRTIRDLSNLDLYIPFLSYVSEAVFKNAGNVEIIHTSLLKTLKNCC